MKQVLWNWLWEQADQKTLWRFLPIRAGIDDDGIRIEWNWSINQFRMWVKMRRHSRLIAEKPTRADLDALRQEMDAAR